MPIACERETLNILHNIQDGTLAQSTHESVMDRVLMSHVEIKVGSTAKDARAQLKTWVAAGFAKQQQLYRNTCVKAGDIDTNPAQLAPQVLWLWDQEKVVLWIAVMEANKVPESSSIIFLDEAIYTIDVRNPQTLRNLTYKMSRVMDWGQELYVPWFRKLIGREDLNEPVT